MGDRALTIETRGVQVRVVHWPTHPGHGLNWSIVLVLGNVAIDRKMTEIWIDLARCELFLQLNIVSKGWQMLSIG